MLWFNGCGFIFALVSATITDFRHNEWKTQHLIPVITLTETYLFQKQDSDLVHIMTGKVPFCLFLLGAPPPWHTVLARPPPLPAGQQLCEANLKLRDRWPVRAPGLSS